MKSKGEKKSIIYILHIDKKELFYFYFIFIFYY